MATGGADDGGVGPFSAFLECMPVGPRCLLIVHLRTSAAAALRSFP